MRTAFFRFIRAFIGQQPRSGFTLIELLVVFSIISVVAGVSIASFVEYSRSQTLSSASLDVVSLLSQAKSRAQTQVKPTECGSSILQGYEVRICGLTGSACATENTYQLAVVCGGATQILATKQLPDQVSFTEATSTSFRFLVVNGGVEGDGAVTLSAYNSEKVITVSAQGAITAE